MSASAFRSALANRFMSLARKPAKTSSRKRVWTVSRVSESGGSGDCAAAPALNYARMVYPFEQYKHLMAYAGRLAERPSFARALKEAAPILAVDFSLGDCRDEVGESLPICLPGGKCTDRLCLGQRHLLCLL